MSPWMRRGHQAELKKNAIKCHRHHQQSKRSWEVCGRRTLKIKVIGFNLGRLPLKSRICSWMLTITMCIAVASLSQSYLLGVWLVNVSYWNSYAFKIAWFLLQEMVGVILCCIIISFLHLVVKLLVWW